MVRRPLFYFSCLHSPGSPFAPPPFVSRLLIYRYKNDGVVRRPSLTSRPSISRLSAFPLSAGLSLPVSPSVICQLPHQLSSPAESSQFPRVQSGPTQYSRRWAQPSASVAPSSPNISNASHQTFKEATRENSGLTRFNGRAQLASPPVQAIPALNFKPKSHCSHSQNTKADRHQPVYKPAPTCEYAHIFSHPALLNKLQHHPLDKA